VQMIRDAKGHVDVHAPGTFLTAESYPREGGRGKRRFIALMEPRDRPQSQIWSQFTRRVHSAVPAITARRTHRVTDPSVADRILSLWTPSGRLSRSRT
jgi:hypothetical protein